MSDTYGIEYSGIIAIFALGVAIAAFIVQYFSHKRSERSEQISLSRDIWDRIENQYTIIKVWTLLKETVRQSKESRIDLKRALGALKNELGYFVTLVEKGEIKELFILEYYQKKLFDIHFIAKSIGRWYADIRSYPEMREILDLVKRYHELTGMIKEYESFKDVSGNPVL